MKKKKERKNITMATFEPKRLDINSKPGTPSTFWQSKSGRWFRTRKQALNDDPAQSVNKAAVSPSTFLVGKSFFKTHQSTLIICGAIALLLIALIWAWRAGAIHLYLNKPIMK